MFTEQKLSQSFLPRLSGAGRRHGGFTLGEGLGLVAGGAWWIYEDPRRCFAAAARSCVLTGSASHRLSALELCWRSSQAHFSALSSSSRQARRSHSDIVAGVVYASQCRLSRSRPPTCNSMREFAPNWSLARGHQSCLLKSNSVAPRQNWHRPPHGLFIATQHD